MATTPPTQGATPPGSAPSPQGSGAPAPQPLTAQQQQHKDLVVKQCMGVLLEQPTPDTIVAKARQEDPAQVLAQIVAPLLRRVNESAESAGAKVDMLVMLVAGVEVIGTLAKMLEQADVIPDDAAVAQVAAQACKLAVEMHNADVSQGHPPAANDPMGAAQPKPAAGGMLMQGGA